MNTEIEKRYNTWVAKVKSPDLLKQLKEMTQTEKEDAFFKELTFGTGGLRGILGAGSNRMNIYTVGKATSGLAAYIKKHFPLNKSVAISYDSRLMSREFAHLSAEILAGNGITVHIFRELMPTPLLSFEVRNLKCSAGIMITASHNPAVYNGYKVYGADGCQITEEAAASISAEIKKIDPFSDYCKVGFETGLKSGIIKFIPEKVFDSYINEVSTQSVLIRNQKVDKKIKIVYTPLNGTGLKPVTRVLAANGFNEIILVKEQAKPDGQFPTCPFPNPEHKSALTLGIEYAKNSGSDIMLATDPDCDRVGVAVKTKDGGFSLLTGNEIGILLLDFILKQRSKTGNMPPDPVAVKTIVTTAMAEKIAEKYNVKIVNVLTGFKYIGEYIGNLERENKEENYIFGFEESCGYLSGTYVRDKDGVNASLLICEMADYYKTLGITLQDRLEQLYETYGYFHNSLKSYDFEGLSGLEKMQKIMSFIRQENLQFAGLETLRVIDYLNGIEGLPKSDVVKFILTGGCSLVVRPSGTEPKLKIYSSVRAKTRDEAERITEGIFKDIENIIAKI